MKLEELDPESPYVLCEDVTNPKPDRRRKDLLGCEVFPAGTVFVVTTFVVDQDKPERRVTGLVNTGGGHGVSLHWYNQDDRRVLEAILPYLHLCGDMDARLRALLSFHLYGVDARHVVKRLVESGAVAWDVVKHHIRELGREP